jgi:hypothetical protein
MTVIIDGSNGLTFPDVSIQATSATNATNISAGTLPFARLPTGSVLQVKQSILTGIFSTSSTSYVNTGLTASITPKFSTSKILVLCTMSQCLMDNNLVSFNGTLYRGGTNLSPNAAVTKGFSEINSVASGPFLANQTMIYLDSPSTASNTTYSAYIGVGSSGSITINQDGGTSTIILMEVAG